MIKQLEKGLSVCKLLDAIRARPTLFRSVFVSGCIFDQDADDLGQNDVQILIRTLAQIALHVVAKMPCVNWLFAISFHTSFFLII
jgi:hypothetical protein